MKQVKEIINNIFKKNNVDIDPHYPFNGILKMQDIHIHNYNELFYILRNYISNYIKEKYNETLHETIFDSLSKSTYHTWKDNEHLLIESIYNYSFHNYIILLFDNIDWNNFKYIKQNNIKFNIVGKRNPIYYKEITNHYFDASNNLILSLLDDNKIYELSKNNEELNYYLEDYINLSKLYKLDFDKIVKEYMTKNELFIFEFKCNFNLIN